jgi:anti-anti-sigma factor
MAMEWSDDIVLSELSEEPALSEELNAIADRIASTEPERVPHVVLNLGRVSYLNSSNLAQLLRIRKLIAAAGRTLKLCAVTEEVWSVMMVTGLDKVFRFAPDPMTALAGIQLEDEAQGG